MDVNPKDEQNVLLVQEKGSDKMNVVAGLDSEGMDFQTLSAEKVKQEFCLIY